MNGNGRLSFRACTDNDVHRYMTLTRKCRTVTQEWLDTQLRDQLPIELIHEDVIQIRGEQSIYVHTRG